MTETHVSFRAMNTEVDVHIETVHPVDLSEMIANVKFLFEQVERTCSRFLPESELSELNRSANIWHPVSPMLFEILQMAHDSYLKTKGMFNPGILRRLETLGYSQSFDLIKSGTASSVHNLFGESYGPILETPYELQAKSKQVKIKDDYRIDLGGIAKGWTVDKAADFLVPYGSGFVNAGGDIRIFGDPRREWNIGVENPFSPDQDLDTLVLNKGAVATSSVWKRRWERDGQWFHHLIDPQTGTASDSPIVSATVTSPTAAEADVAAKVALLLGPNKGLQWIAERGEHAILIDQQQKLRSV